MEKSSQVYIGYVRLDGSFLDLLGVTVNVEGNIQAGAEEIVNEEMAVAQNG